MCMANNHLAIHGSDCKPHKYIPLSQRKCICSSASPEPVLKYACSFCKTVVYGKDLTASSLGPEV